jgi:alkylhydroperoxidase/carboxymuconolactone decarboxylase family protein YurZ
MVVLLEICGDHEPWRPAPLDALGQTSAKRRKFARRKRNVPNRQTFLRGSPSLRRPAPPRRPQARKRKISDPKTPTPVTDHLRATGAWNPAWDEFAELDPEWTEKFLDMGLTPVKRGVLDRKTWELIAIAVDASCTHMYGPGVRRHIRGALEAGATKEEVLAVLQAVTVLGIHSMSLGAPILVEELGARTTGEREA